MNSLYEQMKPLPFVIFEIQDLSKKHNNSVILPPFQNIRDFSFVPSQTSLALTEFTQKYVNIYNSK